MIVSPLCSSASAGIPSVTWPKMSYLRPTPLLSPLLMENWLPIASGLVPYIATAPKRYAPTTGSEARVYPGPPDPVLVGSPAIARDACAGHVLPVASGQT